jgi:Predicted permease.
MAGIPLWRYQPD